jgi:opacity protein-like surface antigen
MRKYFVLVGVLVMIAVSALAQEFPKVETSPAFMFIRNKPNLNNLFVIQPPAGGPPQVLGSNSFNCAGGGGTIAYNLTSMLGIAADMGGCKYFGNTIAAGTKVSGSQFTYLFGPRLTFRNASPLTPFFELNFGGDRLALTCKSSATACVNATGGNTFSKNAFAMSVGGGFDIKINKKFSIRPVQIEYLYTRFGNQCAVAVCNNNNNQNSLRLKSGIVIAWGGSASAATN